MILHTFDVLFLPDFTFLVFCEKYDFSNNHFYHKKRDFAQFLRSSSFLILLFTFFLWKMIFWLVKVTSKNRDFKHFCVKTVYFAHKVHLFVFLIHNLRFNFCYYFHWFGWNPTKNTKTHRRFLFLFPLKSTKKKNKTLILCFFVITTTV